MTALLDATTPATTLTRRQHETLERELTRGGVVAYGLIGGRLDVLRQVEEVTDLTEFSVPWRVVKCHHHGFIDIRVVGLSQAESVREEILAAGGVALSALPPRPEPWHGWR